MFFNGDDDDNDFLPTAGRSKLASLFGVDNAGEPSSNETLTYKAPTEPSRKSSADVSMAGQKVAAPFVLTAAAVFAYKYVDNQYASQGKLGAAVIGSHSQHDYKILLYYTKEKPVSFAQITASFSFTVQPNNYATFYDDTRQNWSLMFESEAVLLQFVKQVTLSKANSVAGGAQNLDSVLVQDLTVGDGPLLEIGDSVILKFTAWLLEDHAIGAMIDGSVSSDQQLRFRIGKIKTSKVWEDGVVGMKKGSRRLLVVPPSIPYDFDGKIAKAPPERVTIFEIEVIKVRFVRDRNSDETQKSSAVTDAATSESKEVEEVEPKARPRSASEQPSPPAKPDKARLISRMAKMGQSMLPQLPNQSDQSDAGDNDVSVTSPRVASLNATVSKPDVSARPVHVQQQQPVQHPIPTGAVDYPAPSVNQQPYIPQSQNFVNNMFQGHVPTSQLALYQPQQFPPVMAGSGYPQFVTQPYATPMFGSISNPVFPQLSVQQTPAAPNLSDPNVPMMMMETRQQNTDVRISLSKISDKVDRISDKIDQFGVQQSTSLSLSGSLPTMELRMLVHSIERMVSENEHMKKELLEKSSRIDGLNVKMLEIIQQNQVYAEQSNQLLEQRNVSYKSTATQNQARVMELEQEKVELAKRLSSISSQLADSQLEITALKKRECELKLQLERLLASDSQSRDDLGSHKIQLAETALQLEQTTTQLREEQQQRKQLQSQVVALQESVAEATKLRISLETTLLDKKNKFAEQLQKMETEMKDQQTSFERELLTLKDRLKHEKNSTEMTTAQQMAQLEEDLNRQWKDNCERIQTSLQDKHQRELQDVNNEKHGLEEKCKLLESKVQELKVIRDTSEHQIDTLKDKIDELSTWKDKYDSLRSQAVTMKQRYEERIAELVEETATAEQSRESAEHRLSRALDVVHRLQAQLAAASNVSDTKPADVATVHAEVKKVMNSVYRRVRSEFVPDSMHSGSEIHSIMLDVIKTVTLELIQPRLAEAADDNDTLPKAAEPVDLSEPVRKSSPQDQIIPAETFNNGETGENKFEQDDHLSQAHSPEEVVNIAQEAVVSRSPDANSFEQSTAITTEKTVSSLPDVSSDRERQAESFTDEPVVSCSPSQNLVENEYSIANQRASYSQDTSSDNRTLESKSSDEDHELQAEIIAEETILSKEETIELTVNSTISHKNAVVDDPDIAEENGRISVSDDFEKVVSSADRNEDHSDKSADSEFTTEEHSRDDKTDDESLLFTDARSEVSDFDSGADQNLNLESSDSFGERTLNDEAVDCDKSFSEVGDDETIAAISNQDESPVTSVADAAVVESSNTHFSTDPLSDVKPKAIASIFDDEDDDESLFGNATSKFIPVRKTSAEKKVSSTKVTTKPVRVTESDEDANRKPPPLFDSDDDDENWMR